MRKQLSICILLLVGITTANAQRSKTISFKKPLHIKPVRGFYVDSVLDDRHDTYNIGHIKNTSGKHTPLDLRDGLDATIYELARLYTRKDERSNPVSVHITQLEFTVKADLLRKRADIKATYAFYYHNKKLIEYSGTASLEAVDDVETMVNELLDKNLENCLEKFSTWFAENKDRGIINPGVQVIAGIKRQIDDTDDIAFSTSRPLSFKDFNGPPDDLSTASASTYSGIQYALSSDEQMGKIIVHVYLTPYFDKSRSWTRVKFSNTYGLNHEQMHFNITAIITCELLNKIKAAHFTVENYQKEIEALIKQANKEMMQLQADYDKETKHSLIHEQQEKWNNKITQMLQNSSCYPN